MTVRPWVERHAQTLVGALGRMAQTPVATAMTMAVIGIALVLPLLLNVILTNVRSATADWNQATDLSAYLDPRAGTARAQAIAKQLRARGDVTTVRLITAEAALTQFRAASGFGKALDALTDNPLPETLVVTPASSAASPSDLEVLRAAIAAMADVQTVQVDTQWVARLHGIMGLLGRVVWLTGALLAAGVVLVIGNTIRLDILNRATEIEVMKLVGATDGFTRRPFLYSGIGYGLGGGFLALALCAAAVGLLGKSVAHLSGLYGSQFRLRGLGWAEMGAVLVMAVLLGWLGSWLAATHHIRRISPT